MDEAWRFEREALAGVDGGITRVAALSLGLASKLAYAEAGTAREVAVERWGFESFEAFGSDSAEGFVASEERLVVVGFRGSSGIASWKDHLGFEAIPWVAGRVHAGFHAAYASVAGSLGALLEREGAQAKRVWFCGHSVGGALATMGAAEFFGDRGDAALCTFGQPCGGLKDFAAFLEDAFPGARYARFVREDDVMVRLPPGYGHGGTAFVLEADGTIRRDDSGDMAPGLLKHAEFVRESDAILTALEADLAFTVASAASVGSESQEAENGRGIDGYLVRLSGAAGMPPAIEAEPVPEPAVPSDSETSPPAGGAVSKTAKDVEPDPAMGAEWTPVWTGAKAKSAPAEPERKGVEAAKGPKISLPGTRPRATTKEPKPQGEGIPRFEASGSVGAPMEPAELEADGPGTVVSLPEEVRGEPPKPVFDETPGEKLKHAGEMAAGAGKQILAGTKHAGEAARKGWEKVGTLAEKAEQGMKPLERWLEPVGRWLEPVERWFKPVEAWFAKFEGKKKRPRRKPDEVEE